MVFQEHEQEEDSKEDRISWDLLSSGNKSILVMIGDLLIRLFESQSNISNPEDLTGIVLIDEIEVHLHPKWKRLFPDLLSRVFPRIQFIASTHSSLIPMGIPKESVLLKVFREKTKGTKIERLINLERNLVNLRPHQLLYSDAFELKNLISLQNEDLSTASLKDDYEEVPAKEDND